MTKPQIRIESRGAPSPLPARDLLSNLKPNVSFHEHRDWRHPLGVYNISIQRVCDRVILCAGKLNNFWHHNNLSAELENEIVNSLELAIYSAAEHVDDIEHIIKNFFENDRLASKSKGFNRFKREKLKTVRDDISKYANTIKHSHGRIRLFQVDFIHDKTKIKLIGFFIEGFRDGSVGPHPIIHSESEKILSITSFLWKILTFIGESSKLLASFLSVNELPTKRAGGDGENEDFINASLSLAHLPLYSFDDQHPFLDVKWVINDELFVHKDDAAIYGSILNRWKNTSTGDFENFILMYRGDGVSKRFSLVRPNSLKIHHWE